MFFLALAAAFSAWLMFQTSLYEAPSTPTQQARDLRDFVAHNFSVAQAIHIDFGDRGFRFPDLVQATQLQLDFRLAQSGIPYRYPLVDRLPKTIDRPLTEVEEALQKDVILTDGGYVVADSRTVNSYSTEKDNATDVGQKEEKKDIAMQSPEYSVELSFSDVSKLAVDLVQLKAYMAYNLDFIHQNDLPFFLTQAIHDLLLRPDLDMWRETTARTRRFSDVTRRLKVNFVAAEESGQTRPEIADAIRQHMGHFAAVSPFVEIVPDVQVLDVSKRRAPSNLLQNTSTEISFFYSTTMRPYANAVQGVPLRHMDPEERETSIGGDKYGTEYQERLRLSQLDTYNVTSFLNEVSFKVKETIGFPRSNSPNLRLMAESAMKHYTIMGITEVLDMLLAQDVFETSVYYEICALVDEILGEREHDWSEHLTTVTGVYERVTRTV